MKLVGLLAGGSRSRNYNASMEPAGAMQELKAYLTRLEEAEKRDHRRIGREMNLFHLQEEATGSVFWHPKGWRLYQTIESYMRQRLQKADYSEVRTPQLVDRTLWEKSGHWQKYKEHMFL